MAYLLKDIPLNVKIHKDQEYVRVSTLPQELLQIVREHVQLDRSEVVSLHYCCYNWDEFIPKTLFLKLVKNIVHE